LPLATAEQGAA